ncbi:MAG: hypothetical protein KF809_17820 [Chloroflexi bacterium]|nr:hypothetical protein [Chloroflexota bacterium]
MTTDIPRTITVRYEYDPPTRAWSAVAASGGASWGRSLGQARASVREALALRYDLPDDATLESEGVVLHEEYLIDDAVIDTTALRRERDEAERLREKVARESERLAGRLIDKGVSTRDAGAIMGVTHGRIQQYVAASRKPATPSKRLRVAR